MTDLIKKMQEELDSIEWDTVYSMKGHYNAAILWSWSHRLLGIASIIAVTASGTQFYGGTPVWGTLWGFLAATLTAIVTFLKPEEKAKPYYLAGVEFGALRRKARMAMKLELESQKSDDDKMKLIYSLADEVRRLNQESPSVPFLAYQITRWQVRRGEHKYNEEDESK